MFHWNDEELFDVGTYDSLELKKKEVIYSDNSELANIHCHGQ